MPDPDVLVVGGGIAGLAAALRLRERGLQPLVLEAESRLGGRMTTDRVGGFAIDTGVTLLGNRFRNMRRLARRLGLEPWMRPVRFTLGIRDRESSRAYRARRPDDILFHAGLSAKGRAAALRFFLDLLRNRGALVHGRSDRSEALDTRDSAAYLDELGPGGRELLEKIFEPGLRAAVGGAPGRCSQAILMQTVWNTLGGGFWNFEGGVDRLIAAAAAPLTVWTRARVRRLAYDAKEVTVELEREGRSLCLRARGAIVAVPGHRAAALADLPEWIAAPLTGTSYSRVASAHVALSAPPTAAFEGYGFLHPAEGVGALELEHLRAPGRCPSGTGMVSVYFVPTSGWSPLAASDAELSARASAVVDETFPECRGKVLFVHLIRWESAVALFPPGRLTEMTVLRRRLTRWDAPIDFCGDYLDGLSSEGALATGEQAAERLAARLGAGGSNRAA
ncbi:MAG TPA: FAD-dependent oxidoreductase [Thermoanaerobaculia bacterium]|nr:FAD-dependent oxidoreductase [Thermoanaerobaculia bacterium]